jgi:DNA-binding response OmpR family regulator
MAKRILAVDDENDVLLIIKTGLECEGYDVITASNGEDGLATAKQEKPDAILLDVMMPKMDGFQVLRALKEDDATSAIPVIMLTGLSERQKIQKALISGTDYYIVKPFEFEELVQKIHTVLNQE